MSSEDEIVTRLRRLASAMSEARFPALEATAVEAADEIERLRAALLPILEER
jgi:predicted transcriptional regulator